jgi:hypothetical protein
MNITLALSQFNTGFGLYSILCLDGVDMTARRKYSYVNLKTTPLN